MKFTNQILQYIRSIGIIAFLFAILFGQANLDVYAASYTVTETNAVLYTVEQAVCYVDADEQAPAVTTLAIGLPIQVTGITSNGWFRIDLNGTYYVKGTALAAPVQETVAAPAPTYTPPVYQDTYTVTVNSYEEAQAAVITGLQKHATYMEITLPSIPNNVYDNKVYDCTWPIRTYADANRPSFSCKTSTRRGSSGSMTKYMITVRYYSTIEEEMLTDAMVEQLLPTFNVGTDYDKIKAVHDYICNQTVYSYETADNIAGYDYRSAYDVLYNGQTVCSGYSLLFQKFMERMGIPCYCLPITINGEGHMFNIVQLDGQWYTVDCTWDDQSYGIIYTYFLKGYSRYGKLIAGYGIQLSPTDYKRPY